MHFLLYKIGTFINSSFIYLLLKSAVQWKHIEQIYETKINRFKHIENNAIFFLTKTFLNIPENYI